MQRPDRRIHRSIQKDLLSRSITFQTTMDRRRQIRRRYVPELNAEEHTRSAARRFAALRLQDGATGSGKTWVMAMAIVWSHFHKQRVPGSELSANFLIVAPNVIVYQRLEKDFASNRIFHDCRSSCQSGAAPGVKKLFCAARAQNPTLLTLFLTNIQQLYETREQPWTPQNAIEAILGLSHGGSRVLPAFRTPQELTDLVVLNDEAHHVHDEDLAWS